MRTVTRALFSAVIMAAPIAAAAQQASDADLARFRSAYTSGEGLAYVVINDATGGHIYRYGDVSRLTAKKNLHGYMLFTCAAPHVFLPEKPEDKVKLENAQIVKPGDPRFAELDGKYVADCHNPFVKSALKKGTS